MDRPIPGWGLFRLLKALERKQFSGHLVLNPTAGRVAIGLDDGRILRIDTEVRDWGFPAYLMRSRIVSDPVKAERMRSSTMLVEAGVIRAEDGARLQASYLRSVLTLLMPEAFPTWSLDRTPVPTGAVPDMPVEPEPELMRAVAHRDAADLRGVIEHVRSGGPLAVSEDADSCLRYARAQFGDLPLLKSLRDRDVSAIDDAAMAEDDPVRVLFALHVAGMLAVQPPETPSGLHPLDEASMQPTVVPRSDIEVQLVDAANTMMDQNNYEILKVAVDARLSRIRTAWLQQRRHWSRTRYEGMVSDEAMKLLDGIHQRLEAAYERLSDRNLRLQYNRSIEVATPGLEARIVEVFEARQLFDTGHEALKARDAKGAMSHFEAARRQDPQEPEYLVAMAQATLAMPPSDETRDRARSLLEEAMQAEPDMVEAHLLLADILRHEQRWDEANEHLRKVLALDPENPAAQKLRDRLRKRPQEAMSGSFQKRPESLVGRVRSLFRR